MVFSLSNDSVTSSLQALSAARDAMSASQIRLSTGRKVNSAKDDGAAYVIAGHIGKSLVEQSVRQQNQLRAQSLLDVTQSSVTNIIDILTQMKEKALAATDTSLSTSERQALNDDVTALVHQVDQVAVNSTYNGINLLIKTDIPPTNWSSPFSGFVAHNTSSTTYTVGASSGRVDVGLDFAKATSSNVTINWGDGQTYTSNDTYASPYTGSTVISHVYDDANSTRNLTYDISATSTGLTPHGFQIPWLSYTPDPKKSRLAIFNDGTTLIVAHKPMSSESLGLSDMSGLTQQELLARIDNALSVGTDNATYFARNQATVDGALKASKSMSDALEKSQGELLDADMAKEAAVWQALQTKTALATQSLNMANQTPKMLLSLFQH